MSWLFENVVIATTTIVLTDLMTLAKCWLNEDKCCHYLTKLNISQNTVSWVFENVVMLIETMVMDDLTTWLMRTDIFII